MTSWYIHTGTETNLNIERQIMKYYLLCKSGLRVAELALARSGAGELKLTKPARCSTFISITAEILLIRQTSTPMVHPKRCWENFLERNASKSFFLPNTQ